MKGAEDKEIEAEHIEMGLESARFMVTAFGDHAQHQNETLVAQLTGDDMQGLKKILVSLQREIASCLQKLEMG
jgi:hypothetical protein